jgi:hypothetical protein
MAVIFRGDAPPYPPGRARWLRHRIGRAVLGGDDDPPYPPVREIARLIAKTAIVSGARSRAKGAS